MLAVDNDNVREYFENGAPRISVVGEFHAYSAEAGNSALGVAICFDCARLIRNRNIDTPRVILGEARGDGRNGSKWHQTCQIPAGAKA